MPQSYMVPWSARPRGMPGGAEPARRRQPAFGRAASKPRPGVPGFGGTFAILMAFGYSGWLSFLMALFRFVSYPPGSIGPIDAISIA